MLATYLGSSLGGVKTETEESGKLLCLIFTSDIGEGNLTVDEVRRTLSAHAEVYLTHDSSDYANRVRGLGADGELNVDESSDFEIVSPGVWGYIGYDRETQESGPKSDKVDQLVEALLENEEFDPVSYRITGNYPLRELDPEEIEAEYPKWIVHFPRGHDTLQVAVYGDGLSEGDAVESANEFLSKTKVASAKDEGDAVESATEFLFKTGGASARDEGEAFALPFIRGSLWDGRVQMKW